MIKGYVKGKCEIIKGIKSQSYKMYSDETLKEVLWYDDVYTKENGDYIKYRDYLIDSAKIGSVKFYTDCDGFFKRSGRGRISQNTQIELNNFKTLIGDNF